MRRRLAVKRLSASDLTIFERHFRILGAGNQKAINLNSDVFVGGLYPDLPSSSELFGGKLPVDLFVYGPAGAPELNLQRKIIKHGTYKNWRLDGEFIYNPSEAPGRFDLLVPGDVAIIEFEGHPVPSTVRLLLLAQGSAGDEALVDALLDFLAGRSMCVVDSAELEHLIDRVGVGGDHIARVLTVDEALEDAVRGGLVGRRRIRAVGGGRKISPAEFRKAKESAEAIGWLGEALVYASLMRRLGAGEIHEVTWDSMESAVSPFDLRYRFDNTWTHVEVKTTGGEFNRRFHVSTAEFMVMADPSTVCHLYRVYEANEGGARLVSPFILVPASKLASGRGNWRQDEAQAFQ